MFFGHILCIHDCRRSQQPTVYKGLGIYHEIRIINVIINVITYSISREQPVIISKVTFISLHPTDSSTCLQFCFGTRNEV